MATADAGSGSPSEADLSNPTIKKGSKSNPVRRAQKRLTLGGYDTGGVNGISVRRPSPR